MADALVSYEQEQRRVYDLAREALRPEQDDLDRLRTEWARACARHLTMKPTAEGRPDEKELAAREAEIAEAERKVERLVVVVTAHKPARRY